MTQEIFRAAAVFTNSIVNLDLRKSVQSAVIEGIGERPNSERWMVSISECDERPVYLIAIEGPNQFTWKQEFFGPGEQDPDFIREVVSTAVRSR
jgi:hypothetical protein